MNISQICYDTAQQRPDKTTAHYFSGKGMDTTNTRKLPAWRELLGRIIQDTQERERIVTELGVTSVTLSRWAANTSNPRPKNLQQLLEVIPQHHSLMLELLAEEFPGFSLSTDENATEHLQKIPSAFYTRIIRAFSNTPHNQRFWSLSNLILQQALGQLDPNHLGLALTIVQCMPPSTGNMIRSLRERVGHGTPPWHTNLEQKAIFLGAESLSGYVVTNCRSRIIQNRTEDQGLFPAHWIEWEKSAAAYPIMQAGNIAGCLLISSAYPNFFLPFRCTLIEHYAELMTLIFEPHEFYPPQQIHLLPMPFYQTQEKHLAQFHQRVSEVMKEVTKNRRPLDLMEAQQVVWQQFEKELLELP